MTIKTIFVETLEMLGPGLPSWDEGVQSLRDGTSYSDAVPAEGSQPQAEPMSLAPNERRRTTAATRLALGVTERLAQRSSIDLSELPSVFASSAGDLHITDRVCTALGRPGIPVSPTHFHNIVHNATAGYWSIGTHARAASTSLSAGDATFVAGLHEAIATAEADRIPVLFVCYEQPAPALIDRHLPIYAPFAVAMVVSPERVGQRSVAMHLERVPKCDDTRMTNEALERLRAGNAAARALPVLQRIALGSAEPVYLGAAVGGARSSVAIHVDAA